MSDNTEIESRFTELVAFIRDTIGEHEMPITRDTLLEDDLGVSGDDADNLIRAFGNKYNIDVTKFKFGEYFLSEPGIFDFISNRKVKPFAVGYLEKAIIVGRLDEEIIKLA